MAKQTLGFSSTVFRKKFRNGMSEQNYRDNEIIFSQGDAADAVFYIQSGTVDVYKRQPSAVTVTGAKSHAF